MITVGSTGNTIKGSVQDVAVAPLLRSLREYDAQLYIQWNPKKRRGEGLWEIRRHPDSKTIKPSYLSPIPEKSPHRQGDVYEMLVDGVTILWPKYHENNLIHHVMDVEILGYHVLKKIQQMDIWGKEQFGKKGENFSKEIEYLEAKYDEKVDDDSYHEMQYHIKQYKKEMNYLYEYYRGGGDLTRLVGEMAKLQ